MVLRLKKYLITIFGILVQNINTKTMPKGHDSKLKINKFIITKTRIIEKSAVYKEINYLLWYCHEWIRNYKLRIMNGFLACFCNDANSTFRFFVNFAFHLSSLCLLKGNRFFGTVSYLWANTCTQ